MIEITGINTQEFQGRKLFYRAEHVCRLPSNSSVTVSFPAHSKKIGMLRAMFWDSGILSKENTIHIGRLRENLKDEDFRARLGNVVELRYGEKGTPENYFQAIVGRFADDKGQLLTSVFGRESELGITALQVLDRSRFSQQFSGLASLAISNIQPGRSRLDSLSQIYCMKKCEEQARRHSGTGEIADILLHQVMGVYSDKSFLAGLDMFSAGGLYYGIALAYVSEAIGLNPSHIRATFLRGVIALAFKDYRWAETELRSVLRAVPGDAKATEMLEKTQRAVKN